MKYNYGTFLYDIKFLYWISYPKDLFYNCYLEIASKNLKEWRENKFKTKKNLKYHIKGIKNTIQKLYPEQQEIANFLLKESFK